MPNVIEWKTRLAVTYTDEDGNSGPITPIDSFTPTFSLAVEQLHSLEATHIGAIFSPPSISFSMTVKAMGDAVGILTSLALQGKRFQVLLQETQDSHDWSFSHIVMDDCIITSASPSPTMISGVPAATFSGFSLKTTATPKNAKEASVGHK
jgi:hypothetical protein